MVPVCFPTLRSLPPGLQLLLTPFIKEVRLKEGKWVVEATDESVAESNPESTSWDPWLGLFPLPDAMSGQVPLKRKIICRVSYMVPQLWELRVLRENSRRNLCRERKLEYTKYEVADSSTAGERKLEEKKEAEVKIVGTLALSPAVTSFNTCS